MKMEGLACLAPSLVCWGFFYPKKEVYCITSCFLGMEMLALLSALMG